MLIRCRFSDIQMVVLVVGRGKAEISVHENVLFEASPVLKTAFNSRLKESSERSIYLPNDDVTLTDIMIQSLYAPESRFNGIDTAMQLFRLYVLADKYDILKVKNKICEHVHLSLVHRLGLFAPGKQCSTRPPKLAVKLIYANTTSKTPMRKLLVDWFVWGVDSAWFNDEDNRRWLQSVPEFAVDAWAVLAKNTDKKAKDYPFKYERLAYMEKGPIRDEIQID